MRGGGRARGYIAPISRATAVTKALIDTSERTSCTKVAICDLRI